MCCRIYAHNRRSFCILQEARQQQKEKKPTAHGAELGWSF